MYSKGLVMITILALNAASNEFHMLPPVPPLGDLDLSIFHDLSKRSGRR